MPEKKTTNFLSNYIKYCLDYLRIQNASLRPVDYLDLEKSYFDVETYLSTAEPEAKIIFEILNKFTPENVPDELKEDYQKEKVLAQNIEKLISAQKNDEYTKEIIVRFGKINFSVEDGEAQKIKGKSKRTEENVAAGRTEYTHYLFYARIAVEFSGKNYLITPADDKVFYDLGIFENLFPNEDIYYDLLKKFGNTERDGALNQPVAINLLRQLFSDLFAKLRLTNIQYGNDELDLSSSTFSVSPKVNYFLTKDLEELSETEDKDSIEGTALFAWDEGSDDLLNSESDEAIKSGQIFFPFAYNKSQLSILKYVNNLAFIVEGPPGTGKSQTISNLLCQLAAEGKKVLFVSQKQQALRVVKDRLASLQIPNLYGYITNDLAEKEDYDTFSETLEKLKSAETWSLVDYRSQQDKTVGKSLKEINEQAILFDQGVANQRKYFELYKKIEKYPSNYFYLDNHHFLKSNLKIADLEEYRKRKQEIASIEHLIAAYRKEEKKTASFFDKSFETILPETWEDSITQELQEMIDELKQYNYENKGLFKKLILQHQLKAAHRNNIEKLPKEMTDYINPIIESDRSLGEKVGQIQELAKYVYTKEEEIRRGRILEDNEQFLVQLSISADVADKLEEIVLGSDESEKTLDSFLEYCELVQEIKNIYVFDYEENAEKANRFEKQRQELARFYLRNISILNARKYQSISATIRGKIVSFAKGLKKSKRAFKTFERLRSDNLSFEAVSSVIPIWIMGLEDASRILPFQAGLFDYLIVDEASQCNVAYALPAMFRAKRTIIVGDPKQMRDDTMLFKKKSVLEDLAQKYGIDEDRRIIGRFDNIKSVLDIGLLRGFKSQLLQEHYRSPRELIGFSNEYFYNNQLNVVNHSYLTYKDTNRVLLNHYVPYIPADDDVSDSVNNSEVKAIVEFLREIKIDKKYAGLGIAVLTFFNDQADLLRSAIEHEFGAKHDIKISIIEGIQGDERDIVIYSFVIRDPSQKSKYVALAGEGGEIRPELVAGRINVAFSRAKQQIHCFSSLKTEDWPKGIWIDKYLSYVDSHGEVESEITDLRPFGSHFEEEIYGLLRNRISDNYLITNQVPSCGYFLDFVVTNKKTGQRVVLECDGPTHFEDEAGTTHTSSDIQRQLTLESAGWRFVRLKYSDWVSERFDKDFFIDQITRALP